MRSTPRPRRRASPPPRRIWATSRTAAIPAAGTRRARSRRSSDTPRCSPGNGLHGLDGTAWYHPQRLTLDSRAVAPRAIANPAQDVLDVHATHGHNLPSDSRSTPSARRSAAPRVPGGRDDPRPAVEHPAREPAAPRPARHLRAQRPELGVPRQRVHRQPDPVPHERRAPMIASAPVGSRASALHAGR